MRILSALLLAFASIAAAADGTSAKPIPLWPNGAPNEKGNIGQEHDTTTEKDNLVAGKKLVRLGNVSSPAITVYRPPKKKDTGAAVVVFPGGAYRILALDLEGTEICRWLNSIGVTGVLLKYRVPAREGGPRYAAPLQDAQRAVSYVRHHASEWGIDPKRIGVLGFSAGGHLAAASSTNFEKRTYHAIDNADQTSCRPDFAVVLYPGYLAIKEKGDQVAPELTVTANTPPTFLLQTEDDPVRVENSLFYYITLKNAKVPAEMHLYAKGGHGYGLRHTPDAVTDWPQLAERWLQSLSVLPVKH